MAESESETHSVGLPPPTYAIVDQFETLQTQKIAMMALLHNQIHTSADHVSSSPIAPTENTHVQPSQGDPFSDSTTPPAAAALPHRYTDQGSDPSRKMADHGADLDLLQLLWGGFGSGRSAPIRPIAITSVPHTEPN
ncbi:hypothetical protein Fot_20735 [Forsythia ovata]|uniref:Uncharacterized protein n=1 Tax=Forsythia ovata TaxID=205694 RepID=A0ABD1USW1_9LAMI